MKGEIANVEKKGTDCWLCSWVDINTGQQSTWVLEHDLRKITIELFRAFSVD